MTPSELYRRGELKEAIRVLGDEVRSNPLDTKRRTFLFELLCFAGSYDRAEKQLDFLAGSGEKASTGALLYRSALQAERTRQDLFSKQTSPQPSEPVGAQAGAWNGKPFQQLRDADPRLGSNLEVFIAGSYTWIPMRYMEELRIERPETLRDLLWARAQLKTTADFRLQDLGEVLLPVVAPGSFAQEDENVALGRMTVWIPGAQDGAEIPFGQRMFWIDGEEIPILEIQTIRWDHTPKDAVDAVA